MMDAGEAETSKTVVEYEGKPVVIYNTGNLPFRYPEHDIQYSGGRGGQPLMKDPMLWYASKEAARTAPEQIKKDLKEGLISEWWALLGSSFSSEKPCFTASPQKMANKSAFSLGSLFARTSGSRPVKTKTSQQKIP